MILSFEILISVIRDSRFCRSRFKILSSEILTSVVRDSHFCRSRFCRSPPREERSLFTLRSKVTFSDWLFSGGSIRVLPVSPPPPPQLTPPSVDPVKEGAPPPPIPPSRPRPLPTSLLCVAKISLISNTFKRQNFSFMSIWTNAYSCGIYQCNQHKAVIITPFTHYVASVAVWASRLSDRMYSALYRQCIVSRSCIKGFTLTASDRIYTSNSTTSKRY